MQVKLLRVLQESEFERIGGIKTLKVDVRLITATNRDLQKEVHAGNFREDLFYRLNVVPVHLPPLRERVSDVPLLVAHFVQKFNRRLNKHIEGIDDAALDALIAYPWPGNIRELENVLERSILFCESPRLRKQDLPKEVTGARVLDSRPSEIAPRRDATPTGQRAETLPADGPVTSLKDLVRRETGRLERELIVRALDETGGNVTQAARKLNISRKGLQLKMKELGLREREPTQ